MDLLERGKKMKYKVGDVVKVRSDLIAEKRYDKIRATIDMLKFKGKIVRILETFNNFYYIKEDNGRWFWNDEMLEPLTEEEVKKHFKEYVKGFNDYDIKVEVKKKEPILDEEEKKYLSAVIRPFRDRVEYIKKSDCADNASYINIYVAYYEINKKCNDIINLPFFKTNTMYKGMEDEKYYTLEELGI